ncbi:hypothetical protein HF1_13410 [Mycoplasma haemofelis str. Langford 1]|uniref:Lipoprotein n=1 Tax=Mycoplasma haemofelis (strain Langford 1) TaxID=941640 RepID=E8ZJM8_MYCHL|nr:hypothetical protein [Mycoplasma haemofelis]CBY93349.1 hypothetical protein HF1_13410 [Mycoplasma haemofelis str. Langford 1]
MKPSLLGIGGIAAVGAGAAASHLYAAPSSKTEEVVQEEGEVKGTSVSSPWKGPQFLSKHYFSKLEVTPNDDFVTNFKDSVHGLDPKVKGKYYVEWVSEDSEWENQVKNLNSKHDKSITEAALGKDPVTVDKLKDYCNSLSSKELKVVKSNDKFTFESEGKSYGDLNSLTEWKNGVSICTRTIQLGDYMKRAYLDADLIKGKEIITNADDISDEALKLRGIDENTNVNTSVGYGKEYLQDRLRGLDDEEVREQIFEWCKYLGVKAAPTGTWNNDKDNFATYCMKNKGSSIVRVKSGKAKIDGEGKGTVGGHFAKEYLDSGAIAGKRLVKSVSDVSDSVWSLRQIDEENYESSIALGKEFLFDRLKEKSLELVKEEVFKWCEFLTSRSLSDNAKSRNSYNIQTYCLTNK